MGWDGSGNFSRARNWQNDEAAAIDMLSANFDEEDDNFATGINACLTKNNETKPTAHFQPNANRSYTLGGTSLRWTSLYLGTGINIQSATAAAATTLAFTDATSARTVTFPDATGTVDLLEVAQTITAIKTHSAQVRWAKGADVASGAALSLGTDGNYFDITGTTAITSIGTLGVGTWVKLHFDDALTLTHHATDLILPGGANITTAAGDEAEFVEYASGDWRCTSYVRASGASLVSGNVNIQTFTSSGTWTKPSGYDADCKVLLQGWGGGGSGGNGNLTHVAGGGGGGGYYEIWKTLSELGATETVTIGAGGAAVSTADTAGNAGGNTTIGAHLTAYGGGRGGGGSASGGGGGGGGGIGGAGGAPSGATGGAAGAGIAGFGAGAAGGDAGNPPTGGGDGGQFGGGGGGGGDIVGENTVGTGGDALWGGAGGGGAGEATGGAAGGTSTYGGNGGAGATGGATATSGSQPGGGGGGSEGNGATSGAGGDGKAIITVFA